jgi:Phosphotransferase enzyme family
MNRRSLNLRTVSDLTPELLSALLGERAPGTSVSDIEVRRIHQGTASHVHIDVGYASNPSELPARLFVKSQLSSVQDLPEDYALTLGGEGEEAYESSPLLRDETRFYGELRDDLEIETLAVYAAALVEGPTQFLIIAEDANERDATFPDVTHPLSADQVATLLHTLAGLHSTFWDSPRLATEEFAWLQRPDTGEFVDFLRHMGFRMIRDNLELPYKHAQLGVAGIDANGLEDSFWRLQKELADEPITLLHGDPHPGNVYLLPGGEIGLLDWQLIRAGSWAHDVCYAMVAALDPEDRRAHERDLLRLYLDALREHGVAEPPTFDQAWHLHRCSPPWGFAMWAITPDVMYSIPAVEAVINRFAHAYADLDTMKALEL